MKKSDNKKKLIEKAIEISKKSYSPYSKFKVGSAILAEDNKIYTGTNVENRSYGLTICAERVAMFKAVCEGNKYIKEIAIYGADTEKPLPPCGACRQVLTEFSNEDTIIHFCGKDTDNIITKKMRDLLPIDGLYDLKK